MIHISELYGIDIYGDDGKYVGKVNDVILNLEKGRVVRITTEPLRFVSKVQAKSVLKEKSILYKNVRTVGDILIVGRGRNTSPSDEEVKVELQKRRMGRSLLGRTR
ncbi:PRC-barrel domain-containing protein [archaeon]|nr:PRC-barrel domain-containing protein [archaeon]